MALYFFEIALHYPLNIYNYLSWIIGASLSEPHTGRNFMLSTIHKKLRIKIGELTVASIFVRVMVRDTVKVTARLQYFHICSCNGS